MVALPGYYLTGDGGYVDEDGYLYIMGRVDDVINVAGHRLSTGEMEQVVASHPAVAECAVIGIKDADKGQVPLGLLLLKDGTNIDAGTLQAELVQMVRQSVGAFANFRARSSWVACPKPVPVRSSARVLRKIADREPYAVPSTIDDPAILTEIEGAMRTHNIIQ